MSEERQTVFNKYNGRCAYCGERLKKGWHKDHLIPLNVYNLAMDGVKHYTNRIHSSVKHLKKGEHNHIDNLMPSCPSCNIIKSDMGLEQFREYIANFIASLNKYIKQYKFAKRYGLVTETDIKVIFHFELFIQSNQEE